ncbi:hypothetical protein C9F11_37465 [Streptomyces sp. YIM 121038]|uniref:hypothetical protein n=1 Tax=Streptomyces sp. YIM 121038 TaxID=2136401 RepID=UPI001110D655|nr:hypothetical protein [Streptomyces sp. YIM 121038]QCX81076.1 hypothetical protein C9F11_37465 [Streptomyces sp. YIM 121038]
MSEPTAPLHKPGSTLGYVPSLAITLDQAHRILTAADQVDINDHRALIRHSVALDHRMRQLLAALAAEGVHPR